MTNHCISHNGLLNTFVVCYICMYIVWDPCMVYLPTFTNQKNQVYRGTGKYTTHGTVWVYVHFTVHKNMICCDLSHSPACRWDTVTTLTQDAVEHAVTELLSTLQSCDFSRLTRSVLNEPRLRKPPGQSWRKVEDLDFTWCLRMGFLDSETFGPFQRSLPIVQGSSTFCWEDDIVDCEFPGLLKRFDQVGSRIHSKSKLLQRLVPIPSIYVLKASCDRNCAIVLGKAPKHVHRNNMKQLKHLKCMVNAIAHTIHDCTIYLPTFGWFLW